MDMKKIFLLFTALMSASVLLFADPIASEYCGWYGAATKSGDTYVTLTWETMANGDVQITIGCGEGANTCSFRNGGFEGGIDAFIVSTDNFENSVPASDYFSAEKVYSGNTFTLVKKADVPASAKIKHVGTGHALAWKVNGKDAYTFPDFIYTYGGACLGEPVLTRINLTAAANCAKLNEGIALNAQAIDQLGKPMTVEISYEISPADAGAIQDGVYKPAKLGAATITAKSGDQSASITIYGVPSDNLALNMPTEAGYNPNNTAEQSKAANDGNENTWWVTWADQQAAVEWWYVDLGAKYDLTGIEVSWGAEVSTDYILQVRVEAPEEADKANDAQWETVAEVTDATGNKATFSDVVGSTARYVRLHSLKKSANCIRIRELRVYGTDWAPKDDTEKPVMGKAELVSKNATEAVIAVEATDNYDVRRFHVKDEANALDVTPASMDGKITLKDLSSATAYTLTITAVDLAGNESDNAKTVRFATDKLTKIKLTAASGICQIGKQVELKTEGLDGYDLSKDGAISYVISPADAGSVQDGMFTAAKKGKAVLYAQTDKVQSEAIAIFCHEGENVALNMAVEASGYDTIADLQPKNAVDNNDGSLWSARHGETGALRLYDAWLLVDLADFYDIELVAIRWEGACSKQYKVEVSGDKETWRTAYTAGWDAIATHWEYLYETTEDVKKVRYVRVWSTEAVSTYGIKIMDLKVMATDWVPTDDTEKPVIRKAELESKEMNNALITVEATDNYKAKKYHVVDKANGLDTIVVAVEGKIALTALRPGTSYSLTITAIDLAGNESDNALTVSFRTDVDPEHPNLPAPAPKPQWGEGKAVAVFCDAIPGGPAITIGGWGQNTVAKTIDVAEGDKVYYLTNMNYLGWELAPAVNAAGTGLLHVDLYSDDMTSVSLTPISQGPKEGVYTVTLKNGEWNSVDIPLSAYPTVAWEDVFQFKFMNATPEGTTLFVDNVYFHGEAQGIDQLQNKVQSTKVLENGQFIILRGENRYSVLGQPIK